MKGLLLAAVMLGMALSGCVVGKAPETQVIYVTETAAPASSPAPPPGPPTYLRVDLVRNHVGQAYNVRFQAYSLDSEGHEDYDGYSLRSVEITGTYDQKLGLSEWPSCDSRMEGIRIRLYSRVAGRPSELLTDLVWEGIHCTGDSPTYNLQILEDHELTFGTYHY